MLLYIQRCLLLLFAITTIMNAAVVPGNTVKISPEIINELKDFLDLIPRATVDEIVAKHYIIDSNFREVLKYLRSTQFTALLQQVQQIPEVIAILDYLHLLVSHPELLSVSADAWSQSVIWSVEEQSRRYFVLVNVTNENAVLSSEMLEMKQTLPMLSSSPPACHLRTFSSFVEELLEHLPHDRYVQLINQKRQQNLAFAQFYAALRSAELRPMVDVALKSSNLSSIIKTLAANGVDVTSLEAIAFKVISWGPVPNALA